MKTLIIATALAITATQAMAGLSCRYDFLGNYVCQGTGDNLGYQSTTREDFLGNDITTDNRGNRIKCYEDFLGNYKCQKTY